ncbi:hypothetical protein [Bacteroides reticulotermitis]|nr:hypothetical protein [Bacteroides reticulotermitis]
MIFKFRITINAERKYACLAVWQRDFRWLAACGAGLEACGVEVLVINVIP